MGFSGTFETSLYAVRARPFPIVGDGQLRVSEDGLEVDAFAVKQTVRDLGLLALVVAVVFGALVALALTRWWWLLALLVIPGYLLKHVKARPGKPQAIAIPWDRISEVRDERDGKVVVVVKGMKPAGEVTFVPAGEVSKVLDAISR